MLCAHASIVSTLMSWVPFQCCSRIPQQRSIGLYLLWYGGKYNNWIGVPIWSTHCTIRWRNCVRTPLLSEPLSILICTRSIAPCSAAVSPCHHAASVSTMKSLVLKELPKVTDSCPVSSSTRPYGIYFSLHPRSWSLALLSPRVCPPRENAPIFTVALQSMLTRLTCSVASPAPSFFMLSKMASVALIFFCGLALSTLRNR